MSAHRWTTHAHAHRCRARAALSCNVYAGWAASSSLLCVLTHTHTRRHTRMHARTHAPAQTVAVFLCQCLMRGWESGDLTAVKSSCSLELPPVPIRSLKTTTHRHTQTHTPETCKHTWQTAYTDLAILWRRCRCLVRVNNLLWLAGTDCLTEATEIRGISIDTFGIPHRRAGDDRKSDPSLPLFWHYWVTEARTDQRSPICGPTCASKLGPPGPKRVRDRQKRCGRKVVFPLLEQRGKKAKGMHVRFQKNPNFY